MATEQTRALHGRIPNRTILAAHHICKDVGVSPKSHFHAIRFVLEVVAHALKPELMRTPWNAKLEEELQSMGQQKIPTNVSALELEAALSLYGQKLKGVGSTEEDV